MTPRRWLFIAAILLLPTWVEASFEDLPVGARPGGMGGACVAVADDANLLFLNPGGLGQISNWQFGGFYAQPFGMKELAYQMFSWLKQFSWGGLGIGFQHYGYELYREQTLAVGWGNCYRQKFHFGVAVYTYQLNIKNYGSAITWGIQQGFVLRLQSNLNLGFVAKNLNRPRISKNKELLPQIWCTGIAIRPTAHLLLAFDLYKDINFPLETRLGAEWHWGRFLVLRSGFCFIPARWTFGGGLKIGSFTLDYAMCTHAVLGLTHQFSFTLSAKGKKQ